MNDIYFFERNRSMYSGKENINILTAALAQGGVRHAVVCPGSRNTPIVHNLHGHPLITCHPVTDERSAGFYALGISQATGLQPVVVCVTSGSALLNVAPAVAEARYQHVPLVVVSADRPERWIGQLDGQTLPQPGAFGGLVRKSVQLPEPANEEERWHCRRLVREALYAAALRTAAPVHINVPISEPLFARGETVLPSVPPYRLYRPQAAQAADAALMPAALRASCRLMVVVGQTRPGALADGTLTRLSRHAAVLREALGGRAERFDLALAATADTASLVPDYILYVGDTLVSKRLKALLRQSHAPTALLTTDAADVPDPTMHLADIIECAAPEGVGRTLEALCEHFEQAAGHDAADLPAAASRAAYAAVWREAQDAADRHTAAFQPEYSQMYAVKQLEQQLADMAQPVHTHYANSSAVRLANIYARHHVWCNRGVNGIEGSLSTAAGFSLATSERVLAVTGDLSFFYDQNALWNAELGSNLRILLLNNGGGGIFRSVGGLPDSGAPMRLVAGEHSADARGICEQNSIGYLAARDADELRKGIGWLLSASSHRPLLLEAFTDSRADATQLQRYTSRFTPLL